MHIVPAYIVPIAAADGSEAFDRVDEFRGFGGVLTVTLAHLAWNASLPGAGHRHTLVSSNWERLQRITRTHVCRPLI